MGTAVALGEIVVLGIATISLAVPAIDGSVRRLFRRAWAASVATLVLWLATIALLVATSPGALLALSAATALVLVAALVRARPGLRRSRGLPPGSLSLLASVKALAHRDFYLDRARRHGPIFKMAQYRHKVVCVVGLERGHRLLRERSASIGTAPLPFTDEIAGGFLRYMDAATHPTYAPLFRRALAKPVVAAGSDVAAATTRRELERLAVDCSRSPTGTVAPGPYLERLVFESFLRVLFGLEPADALSHRFVAAYPGLEAQPLSAPLNAGAQSSLNALRGIVLDQSRHLRSQATVPVCSLTELSQIDRQMPDAVCVDNLLFVLKLSTANVVSLLHWLIDTLGRNPQWIDRLREEGSNPKGDGTPDLVDRVIMETLRMGQSEYLFRTVTEDLEYDGFRFPRGWQIRVCVWESHRDPGVFEQPATFCPDRFLGRDYSRSEYSPFGWGPHACNGIALTNMICRAVLEEVVSGFAVAVTGGAPAEHGPRHWNHWRPNASLRLGLTERRAATAGETAPDARVPHALDDQAAIA